MTARGGGRRAEGLGLLTESRPGRSNRPGRHPAIVRGAREVQLLFWLCVAGVLMGVLLQVRTPPPPPPDPCPAPAGSYCLERVP